MEDLAAKLPTMLFGCDREYTVEAFAAGYVRNDGPGFLCNVRKLTVREAAEQYREKYDIITRAMPTARLCMPERYWYAAEVSEEPI